ncbi:Bug family tripartite tricarboxylate transporter substrate binding protein [Cupriavidus necator]|nr:tripartite tricarboxylate transporter substrate-binding protein [Cupriavidus necator]MDX6008717.1 tripartite tricarboxylate transporter substrate-binding protein [Cupriavidus necator]
MKRRSWCITALLLACLPAGQAVAHDWPAKPIRLVVPYAPGGTNDRLAREYAEFLRKKLSQAVLVENRPGASTNIGSELVAKAEPDGYTFLIGIDGLATNPYTGPVPPFNAQKDLLPISLLTRVPCLIAANNQFAAANVADMISLARTHPDRYSISSAALVLQVGLLNSGSKIRLTHVPYKGGAQAAGDAMGGQVDMVIANVPVLAPFVRGGKLRPLAVTSATRSAAFPEVPTLKESGMSDAVFSNWYGVFAPAGTPEPVISRMAALSRQFVTDPAVSKQLSSEGYQLEASTPAELATLIHTDAAAASRFVAANPALFRK